LDASDDDEHKGYSCYENHWLENDREKISEIEKLSYTSSSSTISSFEEVFEYYC
jgi:hypothetical protein